MPQPESIQIIDRPRPTCPPEWYKPYEDSKTGVPPMAAFGDGYRYHITGLTHDIMGFPTTRKDEVEPLMQRLFRKISQAFEEIMLYDRFLMEDATTAVIAYGCVVRSAKSAVLQLRREGMKVGLLKLTTLWPFPRIAVESLPEQVQDLIVPEMNMGQIYREVVRVNQGRCRVRKISRIDGELMTPQEIIFGIKRRERK